MLPQVATLTTTETNTTECPYIGIFLTSKAKGICKEYFCDFAIKTQAMPLLFLFRMKSEKKMVYSIVNLRILYHSTVSQAEEHLRDLHHQHDGESRSKNYNKEQPPRRFSDLLFNS